MDLGFRRNTTTKKAYKNKAAPKNLGCPRPLVFSVDQGYSLMSCSSVELISAYPDATKLQITYIYKTKSYQCFLVFR